jgi:hypothetical protein
LNPFGIEWGYAYNTTAEQHTGLIVESLDALNLYERRSEFGFYQRIEGDWYIYAEKVW